MSYAIDANLLLYASDASSLFHERAFQYDITTLWTHDRPGEGRAQAVVNHGAAPLEASPIMHVNPRPRLNLRRPGITSDPALTPAPRASPKRSSAGVSCRRSAASSGS